MIAADEGSGATAIAAAEIPRSAGRIDLRAVAGVPRIPGQRRTARYPYKKPLRP
jgi:hypothetical protein